MRAGILAAREWNVNSISRIFTWQHVALFVVTAVVLYLTLVPLVIIFFGTFTDGPPGTEVAFTLRNYARAFGSSALFYSAANSVVFATTAGLIAFVVGGFLAWVTERTNTPLKPVIYGLALFPFVVPGILTTIAWIFLLSPNVGVVNQLARSAFGLTAPLFNIYTFSGMVWSFGIDHITLPFLLLAAAFRSMDPTLEEAAIVSGMSPMRCLIHVNLKIMFPSILATWLLLFIRGIETFEAPALIGLPAGIKVFATDIFLALRDTPTDYNLAATYAVPYLAISVIGVLFYLHITRIAERFATITGKAYRPRTIDLGGWRFVTLMLALILLFVAVVMPIGVVLWTSFLPFYAGPSLRMVRLLTLDNYSAVFDLSVFYRALENNLIAGTAAATFAVVLSVGIAWIVVRTNLYGRKLLDMVAFTPIALPGIVMGLALLWLYLMLPIPVYGTLWILVIGYVTTLIPFSLRIIHAALLQVHKELEEAAELANPSWFRNTVFILLPLILPGLVVAWLYVLTLTFKILSVPVLLSHVGTEVLPVLIFGLYESGQYPQLSALGMILIAAICLIAGVTRLISSRFSVPTKS
jgi:iron(III) transport system permease protein